MIKPVGSIVFIFALIGTTMPIQSQSLAERQGRQQGDERLAPYAEQVKASCGVELAMTVDWPSFESSDPYKAGEVDHATFAWSCSSVHDTLVQMCSNALAKEAIATGVKGLKCVAGPDVGQWSLSAEGVLEVAISKKTSFSVNGVNPLATFLETKL